MKWMHESDWQTISNEAMAMQSNNADSNKEMEKMKQISENWPDRQSDMPSRPQWP